MGQEHEIEIKDDAPGAAPGLSFGDIIKYLPILQSLVAALLAGTGSFVVKIAGKRYRVTVEPA